MATDLHGTELMYNRIIGPRTNALSVDQHKSRHGIRLRSMSFPRKSKRGLRSPSSPALSMATPMATQLVPMVTSSSSLLQRERMFPTASGATPKGSSMVPAEILQADTPEPEVIEEVFPIQYPLLHDEMNRQRAIAAQSFGAGLKIKQVPLPQLYKQEKDQPRSRTPSARGVRAVPVYKDRETPSPAPQATTSRLYLRDTRSPIRNMSEQQRRLQDEEKARMRTKVMKRTAEIVGHRVDRMYYMMGSNVPLLYRYQVDDDELNRLRELSQARSGTSHYGRGLSSGMGKYKQWSHEMAPQDYQATPDNLPGATTIPVIRHEAAGSSEQLNSTKKHPSPVSSRASPTAEHQQMHSIHIQVERLSLKDGSMQDGPASLNVEINSSPEGTVKDPSAAGGGETGIQDDHGSAAESVALPGEEGEEETSGVPTEEAAAWQRGEEGEESEGEQEETVPGAGEAETSQDQSQLDSGGPQLTVSRHSTPQPNVALIKIVQGDRGPRRRDDVFNTKFDNPEEEESQIQSSEQFDEGQIQDGEWVPRVDEDADDNDYDDDDKHGGNNVAEGESYTRSYGEFNVTVRTVEKNGESLQPESGDRGEGRTRGRKQDSNRTMIGGLRRKGKPEGGFVDSDPKAGGRGDADLAAAAEEYYRQLHEGQDGEEEEQDEEDTGDGAGNDGDDATRKYPFLKKFMFTFMSSRQQQIFERKFDEIDLEGQGVITTETLKSRMFGTLKERDLDLLMKVFDLNSDKTIDKREFVTVAALNDKLRGITTLSPNDPLELNLDKLAFHIQAYKEMFQVVDTDGDGRLTMEEIMLLLSAAVGTQVGTDKELVRAIIKVLDKDGNGSIDFVEYLSFIPFFLHIHQYIVQRPISITDVENARQAVQKALSRRSL